MFDPNDPLSTVYLAGSPGEADRWLDQGVRAAPADASPLAAGRVAAWLTPEALPRRADTVCLVAAVETARVVVADGDLARGAEAAPLAEDSRRLAEAYTAGATPLAAYRLGQFRRPQVWIQGNLSPTTLARLPLVETAPLHEPAYARQVYQALRAMVGAPADAPLPALVAAAVARGRARLVASYPDPDPVYLYSVDEGVWYFSLALAYNVLTAYP